MALVTPRELHRLKLHGGGFEERVEVLFMAFDDGSRRLHGRVNYQAVDPNLQSSYEIQET